MVDFPSLVAGFCALALTWAGRDCWKRWLAHQDVRREVDTGLAAAERRIGAELDAVSAQVSEALAELRAETTRKLSTVDAAQRGMIEDMRAAKAELDKLNRVAASGAMSGGRRASPIALGPKG